MKKKDIIILILAVILIFCGCKNNKENGAGTADTESMAQNTEGGRENYVPPDDAGSPFDSLTSDMSVDDAYLEICRHDNVLVFRNGVADFFTPDSEYTRYVQGPWYAFCDDVEEEKDATLYAAVYIEEALAKQYGFDSAEILMKTVRFDGTGYNFTEKCLKSGKERSGSFPRLRTISDVHPITIDYVGTKMEICYLSGEEDASFDELRLGEAPLYEESEDRFIIFSNLYTGQISSRIENIINVPHYFEDIDGTLTAEEALDRVKRRDVVVFEDGKLTAGDLTWSIFYNDSTDSNYLKTEVMIAHYYTLDKDRVSEELYEAEKENYPQLYLSILEYNRVSEEYAIRTRDYRETGFSESGSYKYLKKFEGDLPSGAVYKHYTEYILVDDDTLTHEEIMKSLYSSNIRENVRSRTVYTDYHD